MSAPLRPLQPRPPGQQPPLPSSTLGSKAKRPITKVACTSCHARKYKCDGSRPTCKPCQNKSLTCKYDYAEGEARPSLKRKNIILQRDLGDTLELLWHMQHGSETDATTMFDRIRGGEDPSTILASLSLLDLGGPSKRTQGTAESSTLSEANIGKPSSVNLAQKSGEPHEPDLQPTGQHVKPAYLGYPASQSCSQVGSATVPQGLVAPESPASSHRLSIPDFSDPAPLAAALRSRSSVLKHAFSVFLQCTATIFHVYTQDEVNKLLERSLREDANVQLATLCEACSIGAIGSRYSRAQIPPEHGNYYFIVARQLLDDCIDQMPLRAIKVCTLLAMCNIINKATTAFAYVELGLGVARLQGLLQRERRRDIDAQSWIDSKKVCQSLLLCKGWLQTTLSYVPPRSDSMHIEDVELAFDPETDIEDSTFYQSQVAKLTLIKSDIFRRMLQADFSLESSKAIHASLNKWAEALPTQMRLENISTASVGPETRLARLYLHSFHLGGEMLVYRWILSWITQARQTNKNIEHELDKEAAWCAEQGTLAAKKSAELVHTIYSEGGAVKHCWLCIFQGYLSCCLILYDTIQMVLCCVPDPNHGQNLAIAEKSLEVLFWSGQLDSTARQYHAVLRPILECAKAGVRNPPINRYHQTTGHYHFTRIEGTSPLHIAARDLSHLLYVPLRDGTDRSLQKRDRYQPNIEQTTTNLDEIGLGVHLYWTLEFAAPGSGDETKEPSTIDRATTASLSLQSAIQNFGQFTDGGIPSGWATNRPFTDPSLVEGASTTNIFN